ncbi:MAG: hypothetical protein H0W30_06595 [Gemmatimonadaceae bacterium]|nr:hypothetical protein [Gemmatimonadaceae bacterium]MDQ3519447.1 6-bladed beta-propeller [Gemmatimonadota bacterium]
MDRQSCKVSISANSRVIIGASDDPDDELYRVTSAFMLADGRIVIANAGTSQIRFYSADGRFALSKGRAGSGPGEFSSLSGVWPINDTLIAAFDRPQRRLSLFRTDGDFVSSRQLELASGIRWPHAVGVLDTTIVAINGQVFESGQMGVGIVRPPSVFVRFALDGSLIDTVLTTPGHEFFVPNTSAVVTTRTRPFGLNTEYAAASGTLYFGDTGGGEIKAVAPGRRPVLVARVPLDRKRVSAGDVRAFKNSERARARNAAQAARARFLDRVPFPSEFPAFDRLLVDEELNIWLRPFEFPGEGSREWLVVLKETQTLCRAVLPPRTEPLYVAKGVLLALFRGEDDKEEVRVYDMNLTRP